MPEVPFAASLAALRVAIRPSPPRVAPPPRPSRASGVAFAATVQLPVFPPLPAVPARPSVRVRLRRIVRLEKPAPPSTEPRRPKETVREATDLEEFVSTRHAVPFSAGHSTSVRHGFADSEFPTVTPHRLPPDPDGEASSDAARNRPLVAAVWGAVTLLVGGAVFAVSVLGGGRSTRGAAGHPIPRAAQTTLEAAHATPVSPSPAVAPVSVAEATSPVAVTSVAVDALPTPAVPPHVSRVTLSLHAKGHRIFVDGRVAFVASETPMSIPCGRHTVRIGSAGKPRVLDLACGTDVVLP